MIFTTFGKAIIMKPIKPQIVQTAYQMNDVDHVNIQIELVFEIAFKKVEKFDIE